MHVPFCSQTWALEVRTKIEMEGNHSIAYLLSCSSTLVPRDFLDGTLDLDQVDILIPQLDDAGENGLNLCELVLVAGNKVQMLWDCCCGGGCHND